MDNHCCNLCGYECENLLDLGSHPIANQLSASEGTDVPRHPMIAVGCTHCGLLQLSQAIDPSLFYTDYATPSEWKREPHIEKLIRALGSELSSQARVLDVGCNDGRFLRHLIAGGWSNVMGLEPTRNTTQAAIDAGLMVVNESLSLSTATELIREHGAWDCVSIRQVLEHIAELDEFGKSLNRLLVDNGLLVIEVPDSRINLQSHDYALWEEHVNYFTPETLETFLNCSGFKKIDQYESQFSGMCLTVLARKVARNEEITNTSDIPSRQIVASQVQDFRKWARDFETFKRKVQAEVSLQASKGDVILYGVGSRSSNFINIMGLSEYISFAVDDQPQKQNRFMPGSDIPIISRGEGLQRMRPNSIILLGVNGENEESLIEDFDSFSADMFSSVLPPSDHLLEAWNFF